MASDYLLQPGRLQHLSESCQQQSAVCCLSTKGQPWQSLPGLYIGDSLNETSLQCEYLTLQQSIAYHYQWIYTRNLDSVVWYQIYHSFRIQLIHLFTAPSSATTGCTPTRDRDCPSHCSKEGTGEALWATEPFLAGLRRSANLPPNAASRRCPARRGPAAAPAQPLAGP